MTDESSPMSAESAATLAALKRAVKNTLERKRRLGHYAVVWKDGKAALLDEDVEDSAAFYEALKNAPDSAAEHISDGRRQSGGADNRGDYRSGNK